MSGETFLRLDAGGEYGAWVRTAPDGGVAASGHGPLDEIASALAGERVIAVVPSEEVLLTQAVVPGRNKRVLAQAIPFALEDSLAADVEDLHFAIGQREGDAVNVAVVDHGRMEHWLEQLQSAGINSQAMVADLLLLPVQENQWTLACFGGKCLLRQGNQRGLMMDGDNYAVVLSMALAEAEDSLPESIQFYAPEGADLPLPETEVPLELHVLPGDTLQWLARFYNERQALNLLQGQYSRRERVGRYWRPWRMVASLAAVWLVMQFVVSMVDYHRYDNQRVALKEDIENIYRGVFPDAKKVVKPKVQMERRLRELRGGNVSGGDGFGTMLAKVGEHFKDVKKLELKRISYKDGVLDVSLTIGDLQQLDALKVKLTEAAGMEVDIQSASAQGNVVDSRLRIKGGAS